MSDYLVCEGCRVGRVKAIFRLPTIMRIGPFEKEAPAHWPTEHLAYVEWYMPLRASAEPDHLMYRVRKDNSPNPLAHVGIISLTEVRQSCMLFPYLPSFRRDGICIKDLNSHNVLDKCSTFLISNWSSHYAYQTIY